MLAENLKAIMKEKGVTVTQLAKQTGMAKSSVSQYLSGKNIPSPERVVTLADALCCSVADLEQGAHAKDAGSPPPVTTMTCRQAAQLMHKHESFVRLGLQNGTLPFGCAVKTSGHWSYFISAVKFMEFTGIKIEGVTG